MIRIFRITYRFVLFISLLVLFIVGSLFFIGVFERDRVVSRSKRASLIGKLLSIYMKVAGVRISLDLPPGDVWNIGGILVANHTTYIDVMLLLQVCTGTFVTSVEVRDTPVLGFFCKLCDLFFVERRNVSSVCAESLEMSEYLKGGGTIILFPEGTSSDGRGVLPFKGTFLQPAYIADVAVTPVCIKYLKVDGKNIDDDMRDKVFYYGDITFITSFINFLSFKSIDVKISVLETVHPKSFENRKALSQHLHGIIEAEYHRIA